MKAKRKGYKECRFSADVLVEAIDAVRAIYSSGEEEIRMDLQVEHDDSSDWKHDTLEEFLADIRENNKSATFRIYTHSSTSTIARLSVSYEERSVRVGVEGISWTEIESVFRIFEKNLEKSKLKPIPEPIPSPTIFISHGANPCWRNLKDHLQDEHDMKVKVFETGAQAGYLVQEILEDLLSESSLALCVLAKEDKQHDGTFRARQNIIHEIGFCQGRLGVDRTILLLEKGVEQFSNIQGIKYLDFSNINEVFGSVVAIINREFG